MSETIRKYRHLRYCANLAADICWKKMRNPNLGEAELLRLQAEEQFHTHNVRRFSIYLHIFGAE